MKIAVGTDDEKTISAHFGRAQYYLVFTLVVSARTHAHDQYFGSFPLIFGPYPGMD